MPSEDRLEESWIFWARRWAVRGQEITPIGSYRVAVTANEIWIEGSPSLRLVLKRVRQVQAAGSQFIRSFQYRVVLVELVDENDVEIHLVDPTNPVDSPDRAAERRDFIAVVQALQRGTDIQAIEKNPYRRRAEGQDRITLEAQGLLESAQSPWEIVQSHFPWRRPFLPHVSLRKALIQGFVLTAMLAGLVVLMLIRG